jgi:hypothetical protein
MNNIHSRLTSLTSSSNDSLCSFWRMTTLESETVDEIVHP